MVNKKLHKEGKANGRGGVQILVQTLWDASSLSDQKSYLKMRKAHTFHASATFIQWPKAFLGSAMWALIIAFGWVWRCECYDIIAILALLMFRALGGAAQVGEVTIANITHYETRKVKKSYPWIMSGLQKPRERNKLLKRDLRAKTSEWAQYLDFPNGVHIPGGMTSKCSCTPLLHFIHPMILARLGAPADKHIPFRTMNRQQWRNRLEAPR